jgi:aminopeptidase-like protein
MAMLWVLNLSDGEHSLLDVAERSGLPFDTVAGAASALHGAGLIKE